MNKAERIELGQKWGEILTRKESFTKDQFVGEIQIMEKHRESNGGLYEIEENKYDIVVRNEEGVENVFFLEKDKNIFLKRPNGEELKIFRLFYDNKIDSYKHEENGAYIIIDLWGQNNGDEKNIFNLPLIRLKR